MNITLQAGAVDVTINQRHPNKLNFTATLCYIDQPSDKAPFGTNGKRFVLTRGAAESAIETMNLMGVNASIENSFSQHNPREKVGLIEKAYIEGNELKGKGFIYAHDYPDVAYCVKNATDDMGFSIEAELRAKTEDDECVYAQAVTFTGVCLLWAESAAFQKTYIDYIAAQKERDDDLMDDQKLQKILDGITANLKETVECAVAEMSKKMDKTNEKITALEAEIQAASAAATAVSDADVKAAAPDAHTEDVQAAAQEETAPPPKTTQTVIFANHDKASEIDVEFEKIMAGTETIEKKLAMATKRYIEKRKGCGK